jgi:hypothetical protein
MDFRSCLGALLATTFKACVLLFAIFLIWMCL